MKIPITEKDYLGGERYILYANVIIGSISVPVDFIVDTGSPQGIMIMENRLKMTRIAYASTPKIEGKTGKTNLAGVDLDLHDLGECTLVFKDDQNKPVNIKYKVCAAVTANRNAQAPLLPSLIGKKFLDEKNFFIGRRDANGIRYLED